MNKSTTISVVVPCRNEAKFIEETIVALYACVLPENTKIQVYIVDGMSDDGTREIVSRLMAVYPDLHLIDNTKKLTPFAFNLGIYQNPIADYIQIVGARHVLSPNYLEKSLEVLTSKPEVWCVGGKIINEYLNETSESIAKAMSTKFGMGLGNFRTLDKSGYTDTVTSPMYPMWVFEKIGYFDEELIRNQDDDFNFRVTETGGKIYFESTISLRYYVRASFKNLWKQFMQYGYWKVYVNKKHKAITTIRQMVPPLFVLYLLLLPVVTLFLPVIGLFCSLGLGFYVILALVSAFKEGNTIGKSIQILSVFPILHISYGWGYLKGIVRFVILNQKPAETAKTLSR